MRITLNRAGTYSSVSDTSSLRRRNAPPQSGHACWAGAIVSVSRGSSAGNGRRAGLLPACCFSATVAGTVGGGSAAAWLASKSSSRSSSCWMSWLYFSERGPKCMRLSLRMSSFRLSISVVRESSSACLTSTSAFKDCASSVSRSGSCVLRGLGISAAFIPQLCHIHLTER